MPSGSHRGSRGSHSSGGSRSALDSRISNSPVVSNESLNHHRHRSNRSIRIRFGGRRRYYYGRGHFHMSKLTAYIISIIIMSFFIFFMRYNIEDCKNELLSIEEDYNYYQDMIDYAQSHEGYIVDGVVVDKFYNEDARKYYIVYTIETSNGRNLEGYTYAIYTLDETNQYRRGSTIKIAVDSVPITSETDSVNLDYKDKSLEEDGEYILARRELRIAICIPVAAGLILLWIVILFIKHVKGNISIKKKEEVNTDSERYACAYCGKEYSKSRSKCPSCGANLRK